MKNEVASKVDDYIGAFPPDLQQRLQHLRATIKAAAPDAEEIISYQMPAYRLKGNLVYFGGFADHISFFPTSSGVAAFKDELAEYSTSKGTIQFPHAKPLPLDLVTRIVKYRVAENLNKAELKNNKKKS